MVRRLGSLGGLFALTALAGSCGGGASPTAPPTLTTPVPASTPAPAPTPLPAPVPSPSASPCAVGLCEEPTTNRNPVARVILKVYQCFDPNEQPVGCPDAGAVPVGWRLKLDVTGKDAESKETNGVSNGENIEFFYSDASLVDSHIASNWQRNMRVLRPGRLDVYVLFDGIGSNSLAFTLIP